MSVVWEVGFIARHTHLALAVLRDHGNGVAHAATPCHHVVKFLDGFSSPNPLLCGARDDAQHSSDITCWPLTVIIHDWGEQAHKVLHNVAKANAEEQVPLITHLHTLPLHHRFDRR